MPCLQNRFVPKPLLVGTIGEVEEGAPVWQAPGVNWTAGLGPAPRDEITRSPTALEHTHLHLKLLQTEGREGETY